MRATELPERDAVGILEGQHATRLADLVPVRVGRMLETPFSFNRDAAAVMAHDVAGSPVTGHTHIASGDAHPANFGLLASPERRQTATERYYVQVDAEFLAARQSAARERTRTEEKKARQRTSEQATGLLHPPIPRHQGFLCLGGNERGGPDGSRPCSAGTSRPVGAAAR
ncbi:DUF2252 family protein [Pseudarthrobacter sp. PvP090]|uniref:DUF2252 family protein n=1 Tax=Pseudarthrobacter sp. PvP090 TaxID=3156393 RepID=UPI003395C657